MAMVYYTNRNIVFQGTGLAKKHQAFLIDIYSDTRYPQPVSPWLNLANLLTPTSWACTLASLATVALCFNVASLVVRRWMGMRLREVEIDLWPFR